MTGRSAGLLVVLPLLAGCGGSEGAATTNTLDVLAASSLAGTFQQLAERFEADHPGVDVRLSTASSAALAQQVLEGAPADVLATADLATMQTAEEGGGVEESAVFATNRMILVAPADGPAVGGVEDLDAGELAFVTCVESAPCGEVAGRLLAQNKVASRPVSLEADVKAVMAKVLGGEVDAGFVYATDAAEAGDRVVSVAVPGSAAALNTYAIAVTDQADDAGLAREWVDLVTGAPGRRVLRAAGFGAAPESS